MMTQISRLAICQLFIEPFQRQSTFAAKTHTPPQIGKYKYINKPLARLIIPDISLQRSLSIIPLTILALFNTGAGQKDEKGKSGNEKKKPVEQPKRKPGRQDEREGVEPRNPGRRK